MADIGSSGTADPYDVILSVSEESLPPLFTGVRVSGGHRCEAAAPTEAGAETGDRLRWRGLITHYALHIEILRHFVPQNDH